MTKAHHIDQYEALCARIATCNYLKDFRELDIHINKFIATLTLKFMAGELSNLIIGQYMDDLKARVTELQKAFFN